MIYFWLEINMKNQISDSDQNTQEVEQRTPNQLVKKKLTSSLYFQILMLLLVGCVFSFLTWVFLNAKYQSELRKNQVQLNQLRDQVNKLEPQQSSAGKN